MLRKSESPDETQCSSGLSLFVPRLSLTRCWLAPSFVYTSVSMLLSRFTLSLLVLTAISPHIQAQTAPNLPGAVAAPPAPIPPENMAFIAGGDFWMGTNETDRTDDNQRDNIALHANDARPRHRAKTGPFFLDKTQVTCAQYKAFCDATKTPTPPDWTGGQIPPGRAAFPVMRVNWYEASAYANWAGKRLPTEGEWERAARGTEGRTYPWGNDWDQSKLVWDSEGPRAVGSKPQGASPEGVLDLSGNGFEWTSSWFEAYPGAPVKIPEFGRSLKVVRGGGWRGGESNASGWYRGVNRPQSRVEWIGFRCAKDAK